MIGMARGVASGMKYLAAINFVHRVSNLVNWFKFDCYTYGLFSRTFLQITLWESHLVINYYYYYSLSILNEEHFMKHSSWKTKRMNNLWQNWIILEVIKQAWNIKYSSQFTMTFFKSLNSHCFLIFWRPRHRPCRVVDLKVPYIQSPYAVIAWYVNTIKDRSLMG